MPKANKIIITVFAVVAAIAVGVLLYSFNWEPYSAVTPTDASPTDSAPAHIYTDCLAASENVGFPLLPTDIKNVFVAATPDGSFPFYEYSDGRLQKYSGKVLELSISVECTYQKIPVTLHYISDGGKTVGFGLFTTAISSAEVKGYEYMFFKLTALPKAFGSGGVLLMADTVKEDFCKPDKLYGENYALNLKTGKTTALSSDSGRTIDKNGAFRSDWAMLTDTFIGDLGAEKLFLSCRDKNLDQRGVSTDLIRVTASDNVRDDRLVTDMFGTWLRMNDFGWFFLRKTESAFKSVSMAGEGTEERTVKEFAEAYEMYLHTGDFVLNKRNLLLTNLLTGEERKIVGLDFINPSYMSVSPDGERIVLARSGVLDTDGAAIQKIAVYNLETGEVEQFSGENLFFENYPNFTWISDSAFIHVAGDLAWRVFESKK